MMRNFVAAFNAGVDPRPGSAVAIPVPSVAEASARATRRCRTPLKSLLLIKRGTESSKDRLLGKWIKGQSTSLLEMGDPAATTGCRLCIDGGPEALLEIQIPFGSGWEALSDKGYRYHDRLGSAEGVEKALLRASERSRAKLLVKGKGSNLPDPVLGSVNAPIIVQGVNEETESCWESRFESAGVRHNDPDRLLAKH